MLNISNFMLDLNNYIMNARSLKITFILLVAGTLTFAAGVIAYSFMTPVDPTQYVIYGAFGLIAILSIILGMKRLREARKGMILEDEMTQKIRLKAGANSFIFSFYLWTFILIFTIDSHISREFIIGIGLVGMSFLYLGFWFYYNHKGVGDENPN
jgi:uncharacterized membrane protein